MTDEAMGARFMQLYDRDNPGLGALDAELLTMQRSREATERRQQTRESLLSVYGWQSLRDPRSITLKEPHKDYVAGYEKIILHIERIPTGRLFDEEGDHDR